MPIIRRIDEEDLPEVIELILRVFEADVAGSFSAEGIQEFTESTPREIVDGYEKGNIFLAAENKGSLVGVLNMTEEGYLVSLFVDPADQGGGIGRSLLTAGIIELKSRRPNIDAVTFKASRNAIATYRRWGCVETGPEIEKRGICAVPMKLNINEFS